MKKLLQLNNVSYSVNSKTAKKKNTVILDRISFDFYENESIGIIGESGSGKSTLARLLSGLVSPNSGTITRNFDNSNKSNVNPIQILFQNSDDLINPFRRIKSILNDLPASQIKKNELFEDIGINNDFLEKFGYQLSGGERQRVGLARLLLSNPKILILDEPFSAQDNESKARFIDIIKDIKYHKNISTIIISHEFRLLSELVDRVIVMYGGSIVEISSPEKLQQAPYHPYTKLLLNSEEYNLSRDNIVLEDFDGDSHCCYYCRCKNRLEICRTEIKIIEKPNLIVYCNNPIT